MSGFYRQCQNCGYVEPVAWSTSYYDREKEIADLDEFKQQYPDLFARLQPFGSVVLDGIYAYQICKQRKGYFPTKINRLPISIFNARDHTFRKPVKGYFDKSATRFGHPNPSTRTTFHHGGAAA